MLHSSALAISFQGHNAHCHAGCIADTGLNVVQFLDRARDQKASLTSITRLLPWRLGAGHQPPL
jgi:hypothetical protein